MNRSKREVFATLPPAITDDLMPEIQAAIREQGAKLVILDDDPTGTQTVHDVTVLTTWAEAVLTDALLDPDPAVFILTNARSMTPAEAETLNREVAANLQAASLATRRGFAVISRSDSTLRGHFPL